jgi:hypothetical protein
MFKKFLALLSLLFFVTACGNAHETPKAATPTDLIGHWHQTKGMHDETMDADITSDTIRIHLTMGDSTGVYWIGSFDPNRAISGAVISLGDTDAMSTQLYASNEKTKTFTYKNGDLSYEFSIMGISSTIHLSHGE